MDRAWHVIVLSVALSSVYVFPDFCRPKLVPLVHTYHINHSLILSIFQIEKHMDLSFIFALLWVQGP